MRTRTFTLEHVFYIFIFLLALGIRVINLGELPLSDYEADAAMRAHQVSRGEPAEMGTQPGYVLLTGLLFFFTGSGEAAARFWPVLAGSSLVFLPFLFREQLGRKAAIAAAVGLALDPGLVLLSQLAAGPVMAVGFLLLALAAWYNGWVIAAGILAGLSLLSGPAVIAGGVSLAVAAGIARAFGLVLTKEDRTVEEVPSAESSPAGTTPVRAGLLAAGGTLLLAGTLFLRYPQGLSAFASSLPAYLEGWAVSSGVPVTRMLIAFAVYPLIGVLFGAVSIGRVWSQEGAQAQTGRVLSLWLIAALLLALVYPGRQTADLVWALIPLWGLAALEFSRYLEQPRDFYAWALAALVVVMMASVWTNLASLAASNAQGQTYWLRWVVIGGAVLLAILSSILVGLGWSSDSAKRGLSWGMAMALGFGMLAGVWGASQREVTSRLELWQPVPGPGYQSLLLNTLSDLGDWTFGRGDAIQVVSLVDSPALRWALREMPSVRFETSLSRDEQPDAIITMQDEVDLNLGSAYRGQDFSWWTYPNWDTWNGIQWLKWLTFREGTGNAQSIILWARADLFPGIEASPGGEALDGQDATTP